VQPDPSPVAGDQVVGQPVPGAQLERSGHNSVESGLRRYRTQNWARRYTASRPKEAQCGNHGRHLAAKGMSLLRRRRNSRFRQVRSDLGRGLNKPLELSATRAK
jgi:hypothetical protein